jgi:hypothetical protein
MRILIPCSKENEMRGEEGGPLEIAGRSHFSHEHTRGIHLISDNMDNPNGL